MSDLFHPDVSDLFIAEVFAIMSFAPIHTFQILTKRPKSMAAVLQDPHNDWHYKVGLTRIRLLNSGALGSGAAGASPRFPGWPLPNVWLGTSIESDAYAFRANYLRETPAAVRFLSLEPLLGPLPSLDLTGIDWVIAGGESGPGARPMHSAWVRDIRDRCVVASVPFLFKQWGEWAPDGALMKNGTWEDADESMTRVGKKAAGRELDGKVWDEYPG
jgi:protein gp37